MSSDGSSTVLNPLSVAVSPKPHEEETTSVVRENIESASSGGTTSASRETGSGVSSAAPASHVSFHSEGTSSLPSRLPATALPSVVASSKTSQPLENPKSNGVEAVEGDTCVDAVDKSARHWLFGWFLDASLEKEYLVFSSDTLVVTVCLLVQVVFWNLTQDLDLYNYGWARHVRDAQVVIASIFAVTVLVNRFFNKNLRSRAWIHLAISASPLIVPLYYLSAFEKNAIAAHNLRQDEPELSDDEVRRKVITMVPMLQTFGNWIVLLRSGLPRMLIMAATSVFAMLLSLAFVTEAPPDTTRQIITRVALVALVIAATAIMGRYYETYFRESFLLFNKTIESTRAVRKLNRQMGNLLNSMLPSTVIDRLSAGESTICDSVGEASVSFSDIVGFTTWCKGRPSADVVHAVNHLITAFDNAAAEVSVNKIKTIGDAYWAVSGVPDPCTDCAHRLVSFNLQQLEIVEVMNEHYPQYGGNLQIRIGCHTGPLVGGVIGTKQISYEVFGDTSDDAEWLEQHADPGCLLVSAATKEAVEATLQVADPTFLVSTGLTDLVFVPRAASVDSDMPFEETYHVKRSYETKEHQPAGGGGDGGNALMLSSPQDDEVRTELELFLQAREKNRQSVANDLQVLDLELGSNTTMTLGEMDAARRNAVLEKLGFELAHNEKIVSAVSEGEPSEIGVIENISQGGTEGMKAIYDLDDEIDPEIDDDHLERALAKVRSLNFFKCGSIISDPNELEGLYEFCNRDRTAVRIGATAMFGGFAIALIVAILIEVGDTIKDSAVSLLMLVISGSGMFALAYTARKYELTRNQSKIHYFISWLLQLLYLGAILLLPDGTLVRSSFGPFLNVSEFNQFMTLPQDVHLLLYLLKCAINNLILFADEGFTQDAMILYASLVIFALLSYNFILKPLDIQRYMQALVAHKASLEETQQQRLQRTILQSSAPEHMIDTMVEMMLLPLSERGLTQDIMNATVCFCKIGIDSKSLHRHSLEVWETVHATHVNAERTLAQFPLAVKIKTIGSTLIVAGGLKQGASTEEQMEAAYQVVQFAITVVKPQVADGLGGNATPTYSTRSGVHTGELQAAILGVTRLTYDIFGSTVNMASRCASTAKDGTAQVSMGAVKACRGPLKNSIVAVGKQEQRTMKGFGTVDVLVC